MGLADLIHDWDSSALRTADRERRVSFDDETLRDGLQSASVRDADLSGKARLVRLMARLGIEAVDVGLPGAGERQARDAEALCRLIVAESLPIKPNCAARTLVSDIAPIAEIAQRIGRPVEVALFVAASAVRGEVEGWDPEELLRRSEGCVAFAIRSGLGVTFVAEDATRAAGATLRDLFGAAVRAGAQRVCVADTAGAVTPLGAHAVVRFTREALDAAGGGEVGLDWHGHNDRGLAVANALAAAFAGADRLHATALGVGERVGNPAMEQLLVNARLLGWASPELGCLVEYATVAAEILGVEIPPGAPIVGRDAFRTATGVHAAAILKAAARCHLDEVDLVYSSVPAAWLGRKQEIEVGPMSGASNVRYWLLERGLAAEPTLVETILRAAKLASSTLSVAELEALVEEWRRGHAPA